MLIACIILGCTTVASTIGLLYYMRQFSDAEYIICCIRRAKEEEEHKKNKLEINF